MFIDEDVEDKPPPTPSERFLESNTLLNIHHFLAFIIGN